jgi:hypothetical protein
MQSDIEVRKVLGTLGGESTASKNVILYLASTTGIGARKGSFKRDRTKLKRSQLVCCHANLFCSIQVNFYEVADV